jgi:hypothetical protein
VVTQVWSTSELAANAGTAQACKRVPEAESEGAARRAIAAVPSPAGGPRERARALMAPLDRLGPAKEVAQI